MSMMKEFRDFAMRGNVVDMAVGIIIGGAFGKIVSSFVKDVLMPPIGMALGGVDFGDLAVVLKEASGDVAAVTMNYGSFIQTVIDFLIIAFAIFMAIKAMNSMKKKEEAFRNKFIETNQKLAKYREDMAKREMEATGKILMKLCDIVRGIGQKEGYTMILEKSQDVVIYSPAGADLTSRVISTFNKGK